MEIPSSYDGSPFLSIILSPSVGPFSVQDLVDIAYYREMPDLSSILPLSVESRMFLIMATPLGLGESGRRGVCVRRGGGGISSGGRGEDAPCSPE